MPFSKSLHHCNIAFVLHTVTDHLLGLKKYPTFYRTGIPAYEAFSCSLC